MPRRSSFIPSLADGPRERLDALGPAALSDAELLALLLRTGGPGQAALGLATLGGYVLGRHRGPEILTAFSFFAADSVAEQVNGLLGKDVL